MQARRPSRGPLKSLAFLASKSALAPQFEIRTFRAFANRLRPLVGMGTTVSGSDPTQGRSTVRAQSQGGLERTPRPYTEGPHAIL